MLHVDIFVLTFWSLLVNLRDFKFHVKAVKKDFKKLLQLQEIVFEIIMMLIDCWLLMNITVNPTVSEINTMIFVWVLTWLHFKFHSEIVCWNFTNLVFDIQRMNIKWNLNSDADYTGNIVDREITSVTWLIFETFICCSDFSKKISAFFSLEIIFQMAEFF